VQGDRDVSLTWQELLSADILEIRPFKKRDAQQAFSVIEECFTKIEPGRHTKRGIELQLQNNRPESLIEKSEIVKYFVAIRSGEVIGICGHDREQIHTLFVKPECQHEGIGGRLLSFVLERARAEGIEQITTWSTCFAMSFYKRVGFEVVRDIYLPEKKKDIGLIEMVKKL
jgi:N-acetylglutamate synthase-like GNAT family acetyltransferase